MFSYNCLVCGRDMMSDHSYPNTPEWMKEVVVIMPDDVVLEGKYDGAGAVLTGNVTIASKYVDGDRWEKLWEKLSKYLIKEVGSSIVIDENRFFDLKLAKEDPSYVVSYNWDMQNFTPSCYHKECFDRAEVGREYHGSSIRSKDQGFGRGASVYYSLGFAGELEASDYFVPHPKNQAIKHVWIANAINHFFYKLNQFTIKEKLIRKKYLDELTRLTEELGLYDDEFS